MAALYVMCAIVQCCWSEGLPNARQLNFGVGSIKKKKKNSQVASPMVAPKCAGQKITSVRYSSVISREEYKILTIQYTIQNTK